MTTLAALIEAARTARADESKISAYDPDNGTNPEYTATHDEYYRYVPRADAERALVDYLLTHVPAADTETRLNEIRGDFNNWINVPREADSQTQQMLQAIDFLLALKDPFYPARYDEDAEEKRGLERAVMEAWRRVKTEERWTQGAEASRVAQRAFHELAEWLVSHAGADA